MGITNSAVTPEDVRNLIAEMERVLKKVPLFKSLRRRKASGQRMSEGREPK